MKKLSFLLIMLLLISVLVGCGGLPTGDGGKVKISGDKIEVTDENGESGSISVDEEEGNISLETKDGSASYSTSKELPKEWPVDVIPVIDGAKIVQSSKVDTVLNGTPSLSMTLSINVNQSVIKVADFYAAALAGAEDFSKFASEEMASFSGIKNGTQFVVYIEPGDTADQAKCNIDASVPK